MKSISALYQLGRDVHGHYSCCITYFNPQAFMQVTFVGYNAEANMARFIADNCGGYTYTKGDTLIIHFA